MKKLLFVLLIFACSCSQQEDNVLVNNEEYIISLQDSVDGRKTYTVFFSDGKALEHLHAEEICNMLLTGKMDSTIYNEDLVLTEYQ